MNWPLDPLPPLMWDLVMIDWPYRHEAYSEKGVTSKSAGGQYETMTFDEIAKWPVADLGRGDAIYWIWTSHATIHLMIEATQKQGLMISTTGVWVKYTEKSLAEEAAGKGRRKLAFGTGQRLRCASEPFIIATLGRPLTSKSIRTVIEGPAREHSRKPDEAYAAAEALYPGAINRADIFARETRPGWTPFGNETGKFDEAAA